MVNHNVFKIGHNKDLIDSKHKWIHSAYSKPTHVTLALLAFLSYDIISILKSFTEDPVQDIKQKKQH